MWFTISISYTFPGDFYSPPEPSRKSHERQLKAVAQIVTLQNENGFGSAGNNRPADGSHAGVSAHRLVWNYDDTQGAGILFSVPLIRKQEQARTKRKRRDRESCGI